MTTSDHKTDVSAGLGRNHRRPRAWRKSLNDDNHNTKANTRLNAAAAEAKPAGLGGKVNVNKGNRHGFGCGRVPELRNNLCRRHGAWSFAMADNTKYIRLCLYRKIQSSFATLSGSLLYVALCFWRLMYGRATRTNIVIAKRNAQWLRHNLWST